MKNEWAARLRSPRGQLELLGVTFVVALALALGFASQRSFFERYVREKYPAANAESERLARSIEAGETDAAALSALPAQSTVGLYHLWMQSDGSHYAKLPAIATAAHPAIVAERVERTLVAGSAEQRKKALGFSAAARHPSLEPALRLALERAQRARDEAFAEQLKSALSRLESGPRR